MVLIQCHGKSRAAQDTSLVHMITFYLCVYMRLHFIFFPILLSMNFHADYDTIDVSIAGNRRPCPDIFQRFIISPRVHGLCQTHFVVETKMVLDKIYKAFNCFFCTFLNALD